MYLYTLVHPPPYTGNIKNQIKRGNQFESGEHGIVSRKVICEELEDEREGESDVIFTLIKNIKMYTDSSHCLVDTSARRGACNNGRIGNNIEY